MTYSLRLLAVSVVLAALVYIALKLWTLDFKIERLQRVPWSEMLSRLTRSDVPEPDPLAFDDLFSETDCAEVKQEVEAPMPALVELDEPSTIDEEEPPPDMQGLAIAEEMQPDVVVPGTLDEIQPPPEDMPPDETAPTTPPLHEDADAVPEEPKRRRGRPRKTEV